VLAARGGEATLRVVETTDFNQLPHVSLAFRAGSDGAVRAFLAGRLADVKSACAALTRDLQAATARRAARAPSWRRPCILASWAALCCLGEACRQLGVGYRVRARTCGPSADAAHAVASGQADRDALAARLDAAEAALQGARREAAAAARECAAATREREAAAAAAHAAELARVRERADARCSDLEARLQAQARRRRPLGVRKLTGRRVSSKCGCARLRSSARLGCQAAAAKSARCTSLSEPQMHT